MPKLIMQMQQRIHNLAHELINHVQAKGQMDFIHDFALQIPMVIISQMLGIPETDRAKFHRWSSVAVSISDSVSGILAMPSLYQFVKYLRQLLKERRQNPSDDLTSALVLATSEGSSLSEDELYQINLITLV